MFSVSVFLFCILGQSFSHFPLSLSVCVSLSPSLSCQEHDSRLRRQVKLLETENASLLERVEKLAGTVDRCANDAKHVEEEKAQLSLENERLRRDLENQRAVLFS